jgi:hypothetical protein
MSSVRNSNCVGFCADRRSRRSDQSPWRGSIMVACLLFVGACSQPRATIAAPPRIPAATSTVRWNHSGAPFHVPTVLRLPAAERNAAPLYLDALFEFGSEVASCFEKSAANVKRREETVARNLQYMKLSDKLAKDPKSADGKEIDALVLRYKVGFEKLRKAQQRPPCVFESGLSFTALLPHAQAVRQVVRIVDLKSKRDLANGEIDQVLDDLKVTLRLVRDIRRRGYLINHLVAIAVESIICREIIPRILKSEHCSVTDCDRLLTILRGYRPDTREEFLSATQIEYISIRTFLHDLQHQVGDFDLKNVKKDGKPVSLEEHFKSMIGDTSREANETAKRLKKLTPEDYRSEINWLDLTFYRVKQARTQPFDERIVLLEKITNEAVKETIVLKHVLAGNVQATNAFVRSEARLAGTECLIALKRWQLKHPNSKRGSLKTILLESGVSEIPSDPFATRKAMRINWTLKHPVVYSVGPDGENHNGAIDWKYGQQPGDVLFSLGPTSKE